MAFGIGREDFEAGVLGDDLHRIYQSIPFGPGFRETEIQSMSGVDTKTLNFALPKLVEMGYFNEKWIGASKHYQKAGLEPSQEWFTIDEGAKHLRVSRRTIYQLLQDNQLVAYRMGSGGHRRFKREDLDAVMHREDEPDMSVLTARDDPVLAELWDNERDAEYDKL